MDAAMMFVEVVSPVYRPLPRGPDAEGKVTVAVAPPSDVTGPRGSGRYTGEITSTNIIAASAVALADSLEYAIWKAGAELRRRDERHFTTAPAGR